MCFTAKPAVVCELSTTYEAAISISEASCMGCSSLCRWDAVAECRFVQQVQNTFPDQEQWISICCPVVHAVAEPHSSCSGQQLRKAQAELAHLSRVMTMRELSASIAHEVKQPLAAFVPSVERDGTTPIDQARWVDAALEMFGRLFGGATA